MRVYEGLKYELEKEIKTKYGNVRVKIAYLNKKIINIKPEYSDCKKMVEKTI